MSTQETTTTSTEQNNTKPVDNGFEDYISHRLALLERCMQEVEKRELTKGSPLTTEEYQEIEQIFFAEHSEALKSSEAKAKAACEEEISKELPQLYSSSITPERINRFIAASPLRTSLTSNVFNSAPSTTDYLQLSKGRIVRTISDLHIADPVWWDSNENAPQHTQLIAFVNNIVNEIEKVHVLVLIGDIFETWHRATIDQKPNIDSLVMNPSVIQFSSAMAQAMDKGLKVIFLQGNHDNDVEVGFLKLLFSNYVGKQMIFLQNGKLLNNRIFIAHGHEYDMFNSEDPLGTLSAAEAPCLWQPVGYYLARFWYTAAYRKGGISKAKSQIQGAGSDKGILDIIFGELGDFFMGILKKAVTSKLLFSTIGMYKFVYLVMTTAKYLFGIKGSDTVELLADDTYYSQKVDDIIKTLCTQYEAWYQKNKHDWSIIHDMLVAGFYYDYSTSIACHDNADLVILGHTHEARVEQITRSSGNGVTYYMNDGCWGIIEHGKSRPLTFGEIEVLDEAQEEKGKKFKVKVSVKQMVEGKAQLRPLPVGETSRAGITIENPCEIVLNPQ